jgi:acetyl-CoA carboxylase carboxyl transferase subunit alpha
MAQNLKKALQDQLKQVTTLSPAELVERRMERMMSHGRYKEISLH